MQENEAHKIPDQKQLRDTKQLPNRTILFQKTSKTKWIGNPIGNKLTIMQHPSFGKKRDNCHSQMGHALSDDDPKNNYQQKKMAY